MSELKRCPCCGGKAELRRYNGGAAMAICLDCNLQTPFLSADEAEQRWNAREEDTIIALLHHQLEVKDEAIETASKVIVELQKDARQADVWKALKEMDEEMRRHALDKELESYCEELQAQIPKRGKWSEGDYFDEMYGRSCVCSACGRDALGFPRYCPNCGARMEVSEDV